MILVIFIAPAITFFFFNLGHELNQYKAVIKYKVIVSKFIELD